MKEEINYIAKRYRRGKFSVDKGWGRMNIKPAFRLRRIRIAAAVASVMVLSAAAVIYHEYSMRSQSETSAPQTVSSVPATEVIKIIDFENTPLPTVISRIREVYSVEVDNIPENADDYNLSLHYEGNATDLVETINEILETQMTVRE